MVKGTEQKGILGWLEALFKRVKVMLFTGTATCQCASSSFQLFDLTTGRPYHLSPSAIQFYSTKVIQPSQFARLLSSFTVKKLFNLLNFLS